MSSTAKPAPAAPSTKKRRFVPPAPILQLADAANLRLLHQDIQLSFCFQRSSTTNRWYCRGSTTLYVIDSTEASAAATTETTTAASATAIALHLRRTCQVEQLQIERVARVDGKVKLTTVPSSYQHLDPLAHVLTKPPQSYTEDDIGGSDARYAADSQCSRNATGLVTGLRVASMASHMGELRVTVQPPGRPKKLRLSGRSTPEEPEPKIEMNVTEEEAKECWKKVVQDYYNSTDGSDDDDATAMQDLQSQLMARSTTTRANRVTFLSNLLGRLNKGAMKITIDYNIPVPANGDVAHLGGIHIVGGSGINSTPHVYTTTGTYGDHQGPRQWVPTLDSAFVHHRASRRFQIVVTAPMRDGLSAVGCGEHLGVQHTYLHDTSSLEEDAPSATLLGKSRVAWLKKIVTARISGSAVADVAPSGPHVIPPDAPPAPNSIDSIWATSIWCSDAWTPSPSRSLGFAVGPFKMLEDPEYFSIEEEEEEEAPVVPVETLPEEEDEEEDEQSTLERELEALKTARRNGEGIRQVYFAPLFERKKIFEKADMRLLPWTDVALQSLTSSQLEQAEALDEAVTSATAGVPHRALSVLRDVLALPAYRTTSYTQIWIPNAVHGGSTSGALHCCPEVLVNPFLGGAIMDSRMLPPPKSRLPYHGGGGRVLQFLQARCAVRGWITAALPLGGKDDVGYGYILSLIESFLMSLYERGHGAHGEGGAKGSVLFTKRFAVNSGLNSSNLDFLPVLNIEESDLDMLGGIVGAIPTEDRNNEHMFRTASNGSESHTSSLDEYNIRQLLMGDIVEALERGTDKDKNVPLPSFGWTGSHLGLSFLSSTASSSSELGCGAVELAHPVGGVLYRTVKAEALRRITEGRAGIANLVRVIRAGFIAAHLGDMGEKKLKWEEKTQKKQKDGSDKKKDEETSSKPLIRPPFVICVDKLLSKGGFTHTLFISGLRILAGPIREAHLRGTLVDVERNVRNSTTNRQFVEPEGFPNSYVRGASMPYLRVGTHVEKAPDVGGPAGSSKGVQLHVLVEPSVPDGGIAFGGPVTLRVVENEGQLREFVKVLNNGARADWGPIFLHAKTVTTTKDQNAASGVIETSNSSKDKKDKANKKGDKSVLAAVQGGKVFNENILHNLGYQAIELVRLTNLTPLLWVRVDPQGLFGGKISIFQPDACLAEMLFHDGDASAQIEAVRALAERPIKIQGSVKIQVVHNVQISELPVRLLGDCLRGSPALHGDLPHTPGVRVQAALGIGQWQNNKAPLTKDSVDTEAWLGVNLLMQYFKERYYKSGIIMPVKFSRLAIKKNDVEARQSADGGAGKAKGRESDDYTYFDTLREEDERQSALEGAEDIEVEEDEEFRVRSSVIAAIASVRAKDGMTPAVVLKFMSTVLEAGDVSMVGAMDAQEAATIGARIVSKKNGGGLDEDKAAGLQQSPIAKLQYISSTVIADALLAVCSINSSPSVITDPATGKPVQSSFQHPVQRLLVASRRWLEWELYRETIRTEMDRENLSGIGGNCYDSVAACGVAALSTLAILRQATTVQIEGRPDKEGAEEAVTGAQFYMNIFDEEPRRPDVTRAACAQAVACVCCAADRFESPKPPLGLLKALEYILQRIVDPTSSPGLRQTLSLLMLDTCTGKVSVRQRVGVIGARSDLCYTGARFYGGPLGASNGNDNGSALLTSVNAVSNPAADAVNDGARRGLRLLSRAGHPRDETTDEIVARVARFATDLWRTINGHRIQSSKNDLLDTAADGVCANDGILRCSLLSLWQWIWPKACYSIKKVQNWRSHEDTPRYKALGAAQVLKIYDEENEAAVAEEKSFEALTAIINAEIDRQAWRGEMMVKAEEQHMMDKKNSNKDDQGLGDLLPPILRDPAFKQGGWVASTSTQRRAMTLDGGSAYKIRASVSKAAV